MCVCVCTCDLRGEADFKHMQHRDLLVLLQRLQFKTSILLFWKSFYSFTVQHYRFATAEGT